MAHIILVEDNATLAKAYAIALSQDGHKVDVGGDEQSLRMMLAVGLPDLLLLDIGLPGIDGLEILRELRLDRRLQGIKVAILSNYTDRDRIHRALKLGVLEYVEKAATSPTLLTQQVRTWLER
jgi:DNA-binding response OmpR family regulator